MAGISYHISYNNADFKEGMASLLQAATNMRPLMQISGAIFENSTRSRFDAERGPGGIPWAIPWKKRVQAVGPYGPQQPSARTLQDKGNLRGSIRSNAGDDFVETGVDARSISSKYAATHQFGATITAKGGGTSMDFIGPSRSGRLAPRGFVGPIRDNRARRALMFVGPDGRFHVVQSVTIPARPFLGIDQDDVSDLREAFVDYLTAAVD